MEQTIKKNGTLFLTLKLLIFSYVITTILLLLLAFLFYKFRLSEVIINVGITAVYIISTFFSGFLAGKKMKTRKYLWGLLIGAAYFIILLLVSFVINRGISDFSGNFLSTLFLCVGSGMLGGMLS